MKNNLNIVFFGTPDFAMPVLEALIKNNYNVSRFQPQSLKDESVFEEFKNLKPDICVIAAYGKIIPKNFLDIPRYGFLNIHPSLLPKYRGSSPIQTTILNGDKETGVSIMVIDEKVDHGPILAQREFSILNFQFLNHNELAKELFKLGSELLVEVLPKYLNGKIKPIEQDHSQATFTKMFLREDGRINWSESCDKIYNQIRALNPEPGTWTVWNPSTNSGQRSKVINIPTCDVGYPQIEENAAGMVKKMNNDIVIGTGTGYLIIKSIQLEGGKEMDAKSFMNGHPDFLGSQLE